MGRCFLVAFSHAYYHGNANGYFLVLVCIVLPRLYKRGLKQVFKFVETQAEKWS